MFLIWSGVTQKFERKVSTLTINIHRKHIYESHSAEEAPYVKLRVTRLGREAAFFYSKIADLNGETSSNIKPYYEWFSKRTAF